MNLLMKRKAWLRAARMLAICFVMMGAVMAASPDVRAQKCGCTVDKINQSVRFTVNNCPVTVKYQKWTCPVGIETAYITEISFENTGCCVRNYNNGTIAQLVQSISVELMVQNPGVFTTGVPVRVSKSPCWQRTSTSTANLLVECVSTECCWIEGTAGSYSGVTGRSFTIPPPCATPCEYVCE